MKDIYFNKLEAGKIYSLIKTDPLEAKIAYESYLEKYPNDYYVYACYLKPLTILEEYEKAYEILKNVKIMMVNDNHFWNDKEKLESVNRQLVLSELFILMGKEMYEDAYKYYIENSYILDYYDLGISMAYCKEKIGIDKHGYRENYPYIFRQMIEYREDDFLEHAKRHLADDNIKMDEPNDSIFAFDFPFNEVLTEVKKYIPCSKKIFANMHSDKYAFKYDRCGRCNNKIQDYFSVVCFHNTTDIITMCPSQYLSNLPYTDLNYMNESKKEKVKTLSQIEKFNRRYRNK